MAIEIKAQFTSAVTEENKDIFVDSYIEEGKTIIEFDVRKRNYKKRNNIKKRIKWDKQNYKIDIYELSSMYTSIIYRFNMFRGYYDEADGKRVSFTPEINEISTAQHVSKSAIRLSCYLAVNCGVTLRNIANIFREIFLIPISKSSIKRWIDDIGENLPKEEEILKEMIRIKEPKECHIDGYFPKGTKNCVMVIKDEFDRILITYETNSENKEDAKKFLEKIKCMGVNVITAFSDYSKSYTQSIKEVFPNVKFQADHFHTIKNIWKHLKRAYLEYRKEIKSRIKKANTKEENNKLEELSKKLWELRWIVLKKPCNLDKEEIKQLKDLEKSENFIKRFRWTLRNIVNLFDKSEDEKTAKAKLNKIRNNNKESKNKHFIKIVKFINEHWDEALQYLKDEDTDNAKRSSNSESGMRLLRRLEKNHDGIRSEKTRKYYIKIYQVIRYLSVDITDFITKPFPGG